MSKWAKLGLLAATSLLAVGSLTACSGKKGAEGQVGVSDKDLVPYGKYDEEVTFSIGRKGYPTDNLPEGDTMANSPATRWLKQETNISVKVDWEAADFNQKFALTLSTGKIPDAMVIQNVEQLQELIDNDLIYDLTEIYDKCAGETLKARYKSYDDIGLKAGSRDGSLYGLPQTSSYYGMPITWIRKDWLDKVNLPIPETIDDLEKAMQAFVDNKLGGENTVGLFVSAEIGGNVQFDANPIAQNLGAYPNDWITKDGEAVFGSIQPEMKEYLALLAKWYKSGIIDKEFATRDWDGRIALLTSQMGTYLAPWWAVDESSSYVDPNANWIAIQGPVKNKGDKFQFTAPQPATGFLVISKKCKHPEAVIRALNNQIELFYPDEAGIPSGDSEKAKAFLAEEAKKAGVETLRMQWFCQAVPINTNPADVSKVRGDAIAAALKKKDPSSLAEDDWKVSYEKVLAWEEKRDMDGLNDYLNLVQGLPHSTDVDKQEMHQLAFYGKTKTDMQKGANLQKLQQEVFLKIIMGQLDISAFDDFVKDWKAQGGDEITKEVNELVKKGIIE